MHTPMPDSITDGPEFEEETIANEPEFDPAIHKSITFYRIPTKTIDQLFEAKDATDRIINEIKDIARLQGVE